MDGHFVASDHEPGGPRTPQNKRTMGVSVHSLVRRVPMALGPLIGGAFIAAWGVELGVRLAFVGALAMAVVAAILQQITRQ